MDCQLLISELSGFDVSLDGTRLNVTPSDRLTDDMRRAIKAHKKELIDHFRGKSVIEVAKESIQQDFLPSQAAPTPAPKPSGLKMRYAYDWLISINMADRIDRQKKIKPGSACHFLVKHLPAHLQADAEAEGLTWTEWNACFIEMRKQYLI